MDKPSYLQGVRCWRCSLKRVVWDVETLEDGTELGYYNCAECRTQWYEVSTIVPYFMKLKRLIQELGGAPVVKGEIPANMTVKRPP